MSFVFNMLKKVFGDPNEKEVNRLQEIVERITALEPQMKAMSDDTLRGKTTVFKQRLTQGETLDDLLVEAFAVAREASFRVIGQRAFDVQLVGGINLHLGGISEMRTGEGKTLACVAPVYLNALLGQGVHVVTVNDYLARSQGEWMGQIYRFLGLSVGIIITGLTFDQRREAYAADVTYGTNNEFGFDYLRDNMVVYKDRMVQRPLHYAIVDEVDSILIDEARTPLIISGEGSESTENYQRFAQIVLSLIQGVADDEDESASRDYTVDEKARSVSPTERCVRKVEQMIGVENLMAAENSDLYHHLVLALKAKSLMKRDVDYVVQDGEVLIVDEFTGRLMIGRRYSDGLHQAIEAKEGVRVEKESRTLATITLQNYFRMYDKLSGMTGTALTEEGEFKAIYGMGVLVVPTNKPMIREDLRDQVYRDELMKFRAVVREIQQRFEVGQPLLVGTITVEKSEYLSQLLKKANIPHQVLNAKYHAQEADIIAQAGRSGMVTIATNMAGRGTDIILGGNPDYQARSDLRRAGYDDELIYHATSLLPTDDELVLDIRRQYQEMLEHYSKLSREDAKLVIERGGLHIIGTERHEARRIDNQLRGRAGRQGDPGSSQFFISLQDDLMVHFGTDRVGDIMDRLGMDEDTPVEHSMLDSAIESAQKRVEGRNFDIRKHVLEYDDVMNQQRGIIYAQRRQVLEGENLRHIVLGEMVYGVVDMALELYCDAHLPASDWDKEGLHRHLAEIIPMPEGENLDLTPMQQAQDIDTLREVYRGYADTAYVRREALYGEHIMRDLERAMTLRAVDMKWMQHIDDMQELRDGIGLQAYAQKDPLQEYQIAAFDMFEDMIASIREETARLVYRVQVRIEVPIQREQVAVPFDPGKALGPVKKQPMRQQVAQVERQLSRRERRERDRQKK